MTHEGSHTWQHWLLQFEKAFRETC